MRLLFALFICFVFVTPEVQGWFKKKKHYVTATGTVKCKVDNQYRPLPHIKVELLDDELVGSTKMTDGRTDINGKFSLTGSGRDIFGSKPDPKIKVVYDYSGSHGSMCIRNGFGSTRDHRTDKKRYSRYVNFGNINIDDEHCRAYYRFYHCGLKDYYSTVGSKAPYRTLYVTTGATAVTPYAPYTKIKVPHSEDPISCQTAKHEFGHTIRHYYDGNYAHFLWDAGRFVYLRSHSCSMETNAGFAFNEGWAEYWEDDCQGSTGSNYRIEGNVASALKRLATKCGTSRAQMVDVLKYNRGNIHSFCDFNYRHGLRFQGCKLTLPKCSCMSKIGEQVCKILQRGLIIKINHNILTRVPK